VSNIARIATEMVTQDAEQCAGETKRAGMGRPDEAPPVLSVEEGYEIWAPNYDSDLNPLLRLEERILKPRIPPLEGKTVLDIACGTGRWLSHMVRSGASIAMGIDISSAMLANARQKDCLQGRLVKANCLTLPFGTEMADLAICSFALRHISDTTMLAQELGRVTRDGSSLYFTDIHPEAYARGWRTGFRHRAGPRQIATSAFSVENLVASFESQGFKLSERIEPRFGEAERPIFEQAGKADVFPSACEFPAVLICHFARPAASGAQRPSL
jgi:ubiquinone/menaquinone biosynthesis C-methylase UbiE